MTPGLLGTKIGMTRVVDASGTVEPVTVVQAGPCVVLQVKTQEVDGYDAIQLGFCDAKPHRSTLPMIGHAGKARTGPKRYVRELRLDGPAEESQGDVLTVEQFAGAEVKYVDVVGVTKGRGFAGVMRRHGFGGMGASHGTERKHRSPGSVAGHASGSLGRGIKKGRRMPGQMGHVRRTVSCLRLIATDVENNLLIVRGSIPGPNGGIVFVKQAKKRVKR